MSTTSQPVGGDPAAAKPVGVRAVAARAQVSLGTVSNVMNNPDRQGPEVRARVEQAMAELGFVPSRAAEQQGLEGHVIGREAGIETAIEHPQALGRGMSVAYVIEYTYKLAILLPEHMPQAYGDISQAPQCLTAEEVRCIVMRRQ